MGPKKRPHSAGAPRARPATPRHKSWRKPAPSRRSKFLGAVDVMLRDARRSRAAKHFRVRLRPSSEAMREQPLTRKSIEVGTAAIDTLREHRDGVRDSALKEIHRQLEIAGAVAYICAATLRAQAVNEQSVALCLQRLVGDEIDRQMEEVDRLLGCEKTYKLFSYGVSSS